MAPRAMATGTISFGLVAIPIRMFSTAERSASVSFNMLHEKCGGRVKMQYYCPTDDEVVGRNDLVKGYELAKDQYVTFSAEELEALESKATQTIDIAEFVPASEVDPIFFDKSYFLGPNKGGEKPYRLLVEAMKETQRVAVARYAARGKMYLVLLRPMDDGLVMQQLYYADEVRSLEELDLPQAEVKEQELALARQLIEQISSDTFDPTQYEDAARKQMVEMIGQKVEGKEITAAPVEEPKGQIIDLMSALKASLGEGEKARKPPQRAARAASKASSSKKKAAAGGGKTGKGKK